MARKSDLKRVRLIFATPPPGMPQSTKYIMSIDPERCCTVADLELDIIQKFGFSRSSSLSLSIDGYSVLPMEDVDVLWNNECILVTSSFDKSRVKRKRKITLSSCVKLNDTIPSKKRSIEKEKTKQTAEQKPKAKPNQIETLSTKRIKKRKVKEATNKSTNVKKKKNELLIRKVESSVTNEQSENCTSLSSPNSTTSKSIGEEKKSRPLEIIPPESTKINVKPTTKLSKHPDAKKTTNATRKTNANVRPAIKMGKKLLESSHITFESSGSSSSSEDAELPVKNRMKVNGCIIQAALSRDSLFCETSSEHPETYSKLLNPAMEKLMKRHNVSKEVTTTGKLLKREETGSNAEENIGLQTWLNSNSKNESNVKPHSGNCVENDLKCKIQYDSMKLLEPARKSHDTSNSACKNSSRINDTIDKPHVTSSAPVDIEHEKNKRESPLQDYTKLATISWPPRHKDIIAYKVLQMTENYSPEISGFKEATVLEVYTAETSPTGEIGVRVQLLWPKQAGCKRIGRFEIDVDENEQVDDEELVLDWKTLIDPRLVR